MIQIENLTKKFKMGENEVHALDGVSPSIEKGEMLAIMGSSDSGKSTLMSIVGCLDAPSSGSYLLDELPVEKMNDDQLAEIRNHKIGFVFKQFNLHSRTSALDNVLLPLSYTGLCRHESKQKAERALEMVGLKERMDRDFGQTIIMVTHDAFIARHTNRIIRLADGHITSDAINPQRLKAGTPRPEAES